MALILFFLPLSSQASKIFYHKAASNGRQFEIFALSFSKNQSKNTKQSKERFFEKKFTIQTQNIVISLAIPPYLW